MCADIAAETPCGSDNHSSPSLRALSIHPFHESNLRSLVGRVFLLRASARVAPQFGHRTMRVGHVRAIRRSGHQSWVLDSDICSSTLTSCPSHLHFMRVGTRSATQTASRAVFLFFLSSKYDAYPLVYPPVHLFKTLQSLHQFPHQVLLSFHLGCTLPHSIWVCVLTCRDLRASAISPSVYFSHTFFLSFRRRPPGHHSFGLFDLPYLGFFFDLYRIHGFPLASRTFPSAVAPCR